MNANELRIGNYVQRKKQVLKVLNVQWDKTMLNGYTAGNRYFKLNDIEPIEISEKWLLKLGFECISDGGDQKRFALKNRDNNYFYAISLDHEEICLERKDIMGYYTLIWNEPYLQYIHQLQNLFFSLRGIELVYF